MERAQVLTELSLLYIESSLPGKAALLRGQVQAMTGLSTSDIASINVDLIARGDMATAKMRMDWVDMQKPKLCCSG